jgi:transposase-like protein
MMNKRTYSPEFKAKIALEACEPSQDIAALAAKYSITPSLIYEWRKKLRETAYKLFTKEDLNGPAQVSNRDVI